MPRLKWHGWPINSPSCKVFERLSDRVLLFLFFLAGAFALAFADAARLRETREPALMQQAALVENLRLNDLCLFTEARYTRHLTQADLHSPFQDHPLALEHFPSGSLLAPPAQLTQNSRDALD